MDMFGRSVKEGDYILTAQGSYMYGLKIKDILPKSLRDAEGILCRCSYFVKMSPDQVRAFLEQQTNTIRNGIEGLLASSKEFSGIVEERRKLLKVYEDDLMELS
jgi:hypothetical protein